jgi:hypothetical protein
MMDFDHVICVKTNNEGSPGRIISAHYFVYNNRLFVLSNTSEHENIKTFFYNHFKIKILEEDLEYKKTNADIRFWTCYFTETISKELFLFFQLKGYHEVPIE